MQVGLKSLELEDLVHHYYEDELISLVRVLNICLNLTCVVLSCVDTFCECVLIIVCLGQDTPRRELSQIAQYCSHNLHLFFVFVWLVEVEDPAVIVSHSFVFFTDRVTDNLADKVLEDL